MGRPKQVMTNGFSGIENTASPAALPNDKAQVSINADYSRPGMLWVRPGFSRSTLAKLAFPPRSSVYWVSRDGVDRLVYDIPGSGWLIGDTLPVDIWPREPIKRGPIFGPTGGTFPPVTNLAVSDKSGVTLTWTNPATPYLAGVKVLRRTDRYPQSPWDKDATVLLNAKLTTVTDTNLAVGSTGYYGVYSYSRTRWGAVAKISQLKIQYGKWDGVTEGTYWKA